MRDTILSLSGGLDSSSLLFEFKDRISLAVSFRYPATHNERELKRAADVAKRASVDHHIVDLTSAFQGFRSVLLNRVEKCDGVKIEEFGIPFRNGIFLSILAGLAESKNCGYIALANHGGVYPDCTAEFSNAMGLAIYRGTTNGVQFFCPYVNLTKSEIAYRGIKAGLKPEWSYSCYSGKKIPCGVCPPCVKRKEALEYAYKKIKEEIQ